MRSPLDVLRDALEAFRSDEARARVQRWRGAAHVADGAADGEGPGEVFARHPWLASVSAMDAFGECRDLRLAGQDELAALEAHLADVRRAAAVADAQARLERLGTGLLRGAYDALGWVFDARAAARERAWEVAHPDSGPSWAELAAHAERFLGATDEAARAAGHALAEESGPELRRGSPLARMQAGARAPDLRAVFPERDRWRRIARDVAGLGFERELSGRVRAEPVRRRSVGGARLALIDAPRDVRLGAPPVDWGLASELLAAEGVGRALGLCLVVPGLPVELRRPVVGSVSRAIGTLFAQVPADGAALGRIRGMSRTEAGRVERTAGALLLLESRLHAAAVVLEAAVGASLEAQRDLAPELVSRAFGVEVAPEHAALVGGTRVVVAARFRARMAGLAAWVALRERYDEDWYRNPRAAEPLRAGAHRGGWMSAEAWVAEELGAEPDAEIRRSLELIRE